MPRLFRQALAKALNSVEEHVRELLEDGSAHVFRNELKCFWTAANGPQTFFQ
jgi:hypothetical protein